MHNLRVCGSLLHSCYLLLLSSPLLPSTAVLPSSVMIADVFLLEVLKYVRTMF